MSPTEVFQLVESILRVGAAVLKAMASGEPERVEDILGDISPSAVVKAAKDLEAAEKFRGEEQ